MRSSLLVSGSLNSSYSMVSRYARLPSSPDNPGTFNKLTSTPASSAAATSCSSKRSASWIRSKHVEREKRSRQLHLEKYQHRYECSKKGKGTDWHDGGSGAWFPKTVHLQMLEPQILPSMVIDCPIPDFLRVALPIFF